MRFSELTGRMAALGVTAIPTMPPAGSADADPEITMVTPDSRKAVPGALFCAISGSRRDGREYIPMAVAAGASAVLCGQAPAEKPPVPVLETDDDYLAMAVAAEIIAGDPGRDMDMYAVTGTNGKTTTVYALRALDADASHCGIFSTVAVGRGDDFRAAEHTTPDAVSFFGELAEMAAAGCRRIYFEASSHALSQHRMGKIKLRSAVFTNLTQDHLDYHKDMESYYSAKKRLFTDYLADGGRAVINASDPWGARLARELREERPGVEIADYGSRCGAGDFMILPPGEDGGCVFMLRGRKYRSNLIGDYNAYNLAGAILASDCGGSVESIEVKVPGRLEMFRRADGARLFVDFAHTDDALRRVLAVLRRICRGRLIAVFGAGGDRDRTKRPKMGRAVCEGADAAVVTSDNPRSEDPMAIIGEILSGMDQKSGCGIITEPDRREAIRKACAMAGAEDVILIAGKGHEAAQEINGVVFPFSDAAEAAGNGFSAAGPAEGANRRRCL